MNKEANIGMAPPNWVPHDRLGMLVQRKHGLKDPLHLEQRKEFLLMRSRTKETTSLEEFFNACSSFEFPYVWTPQEHALLCCQKLLRTSKHELLITTTFPYAAWLTFSTNTIERKDLLFGIQALSEEGFSVGLGLLLDLKRSKEYMGLTVCVPPGQTLPIVDQTVAKRIFDMPEIVFLDSFISPEVSRAIFSFATLRNQLLFSRCRFFGNGEAFLEALDEVENMTNSDIITIGKISFSGSGPSPAQWQLRRRDAFPWTVENFRRLLSLQQQQLQSEVCLSDFEFNAEFSSAFAFLRLENLMVKDCDFQDGMVGLARAIRSDHGPRELTMEGCKKEHLVCLLQAVGDPSCHRLKHLVLNTGPRMPGRNFSQALTNALTTNASLQALRVQCVKNVALWNDLLQAISIHPALRSIDLDFLCAGNEDDRLGKIMVTTQVARFLRQENRAIEEFSFYERMFDLEEWKSQVVPLMERNVYLKRIQSLTRTKRRADRNHWNAILAQAISRLTSRPTPLWMLLSQNQGSISSSIFLESLRDMQEIRTSEQGATEADTL